METLEGFDFSGERIRAYRWDGKKLVLDEDRLAELLAASAAADNIQQIAELKSKLAATDYAVIKIAESSATPEEYADVIAQRRAWREQIRQYEQ